MRRSASHSSRGFADHDIIPAALFDGSRLPATTSTTRICADNDARARRCVAHRMRAGNVTRPRRYEASGTRADMVDIPDDPRPLPQTRRCRRDAVRIHTTTTTTTYCAACSMRSSLESCFPTLAPPPLLRQHTGMHSRAMSPSRHPSPSGIATTLDDVPPTEPAHWHKVAGSISSAWARREEEQTRHDLKVSPLLPLCRTRSKRRMRYLRIPREALLVVNSLCLRRMQVFTKDTLETSPDEQQHVRRREKVMPT
ncbi:hypothetical protein EV122DRAFT_285638 [Schizophyllum commune]